MRITIDIRLLSRGGTTGIPGYTRDLVDALLTTESKHQYNLFYNGFRRQPLPALWRHNRNVTVIEKSIPNRLLDLSFRLFNAPKLTSYAPADLIFSPHFNLLPRTGTPRVITFHDLSFLHYPQFFSQQQRLWHRLQHYARQAQEAAHIIAVSEFTKRDLITLLHVPPEKITVIYSGINASFKKLPAADPLLATYKQTRGLTKPFFLYLGSIEPRKNIPLVIKAFDRLKTDARFKDHQLVLAGRPGFGADDVLQLIRTSPTKTDIRLFGAVSDADRVLLYNLARAVVFPSWLEGFGFPPIEAQACGTPVIVSDRTSLPEILGSSAILTDPWNIEQFAEQMRAIETEPKLRETIQVRGEENVKRFTWSAAADQTCAVFNSVLNQ